ncbi:hypothetical protein EYC84_012116 [Monilinia fructicola]|uniref:Uncharacterized protein n=1 Tax=Monilinia fructicola TaxID=38448 RepID=A0A5M9J8C3_MONFR|nr:hypothetical protein EYC84_012116 [Monilinia fructicola]
MTCLIRRKIFKFSFRVGDYGFKNIKNISSQLTLYDHHPNIVASQSKIQSSHLDFVSTLSHLISITSTNHPSPSTSNHQTPTSNLHPPTSILHSQYAYLNSINSNSPHPSYHNLSRFSLWSR